MKKTFLTSFLVTNIAWALSFETFFYNITVTRKNIVEPSSINITTELNFIYYLTATSANNLTYQTAALNPTFNIYRDGIQILNQESCEPFKTVLKELVQPFLILYNEDQTFKAIQIRKDESELVKNMKFLVSTATQVDASKLNETETEIKIQTEETVSSGKCNIDYDAKRIQPLTGLNLLLHKHYDDKSCSRELNKEAEDDINYLEKICNSKEESYFRETTDSDLKIVFESISAFVTNTNLTDTAQFNSLKNNNVKVSSEMVFKGDILTRNNTAVETFDDTDTIEMSQAAYRPVNRSLLSEGNSKVDPKLQELYKSLTCVASVQNSDYDIIERIVTCLNNENIPKK